MSSRLSRPRRTKVYDCNYSMGERYYKPVVDDLDRKYSGRSHIADAASSAEASINSLRSTLGVNESSNSALSSTLRRSAQRAIEDHEESERSRRRPLSSLMDDYDSIFDSRSNTNNMSRSRAIVAQALEDDEDAQISNNLKRLRAARAARSAIEEEVSEITTTTSRRPKLIMDFSEKVLDTVGLKHSDIGKARLALADDSINRRVLKIASSEDTESPSWSKWTRVGEGDEEDFDEGSAVRARRAARARLADLDAELGSDRAADAAAERARKSRARLADIESEMEALNERGAAREKRAANLRALVLENEANAESSSSSTAKSSMRVKKISSSVQSEKKTVTF